MSESALPVPRSAARSGLRFEVSGTRLLYFGVWAILLYLLVPPLLILVQTSFLAIEGPAAGSYTLEHYRAIVSSPGLKTMALNSAIFALGSSCVGIVLGTILAFLVERTNARFRNVAFISAFVALAVPYVIWTIGWIFLLNNRNGLINVLLMRIFDLSEAPFDIFSMQGMLLVDGLQSVPMAFLLVAVPLRSMNASLEEAAAMSGASQRQILRKVTFPLSAPAILAAFLLILVRSVEAFETPALLGLPAGIRVLTTEVYQRIRGGAFPDYGLASAYSVALIFVASLGIYAYGRATRQAERFAVVTGKGYNPRKINLGSFRYPAGFVVLILPTIVALPLLIMAWASFQPFYQLPSAASLRLMTLANYVSVLDRSDTRAAMFNSVFVAGTAATIVMLLTTVVAWMSLRTRFAGRAALDYVVSMALAIPSVVIGLAILRTYLVIPLPIYGTIWILIIAQITRALPFAMRYAHTGLSQIHKELEESAEMSGATWLTAFRRILVPLLMPALFGGWIWVFLTSIRELPMTLILVGPNSQVMASVIFDLWSGGQIVDMAALSVMVTLVLVVMAFMLWRTSRRWGPTH